MAKKPGQVPEYQKLYIGLYKQIAKNELQPGQLLPSESELKKKYGVTQPVIRHALAMLVENGLVRKHQGKGSIVVRRPFGVGVKSIQDDQIYTSQSDSAEIETVILEGPHISRWPQNSLFPISTAELSCQAVKIKRLRKVKDSPVFVELIYIPDKDLPGFLSIKLDNISFFEMIASRYSICVKSPEQIFWAEGADKKTAKILRIPEGSPVQRVERKITTNRKDFFIYSSLVANTKNYILFTNS
jgi:DNA-binding GntR family transcriptional regulator